MSDGDVKSQTQKRFAQYAQGYVTSESFAKGADLDYLVEVAQPQPEWNVLDVATGGGHTALKFAPHVKSVVASDLTEGMLRAARGFLTEQGASNATFSVADAEGLPFAAGTFDLVTVRIAPHHFPDIYRFAVEAARVLKPGGAFLLQDHVLPETERDGEYVDAIQRLRDPSHFRAYSETEWRGLFLDAGLTVEHASIIGKRMNLKTWAERQGCPPDVLLKLQILLKQAPAPVAEWIEPHAAGSDDASFVQKYIVILGRKP